MSKSQNCCATSPIYTYDCFEFLSLTSAYCELHGLVIRASYNFFFSYAEIHEKPSTHALVNGVVYDDVQIVLTAAISNTGAPITSLPPFSVYRVKPFW